MKRRKCINDYRGFEGVDASIETSLHEYGIAWKKTKKNEYLFIYGVGLKETRDGQEYNRFDYGFMNAKDWSALVSESWFDLEAVASFTGSDAESVKVFNPSNVNDAILFHGYENIMGSSYHEGFEIL